LADVDLVVFVALVVAFALLVTVHVALAARLVLKHPRWRGLVAFIVPPLAPYWGMEAGMKKLATLWIVALSVYVVARIGAAF
jgi:hypothetical protein